MALKDKLKYIEHTFDRLLINDVYSKDGVIYADCSCSCGNKKEIRLDGILNGKVKSCGCYSKDYKTKSKTKHGMFGTKEYLAWQRMKTRCKPSNAKDFPFHAGKGISVCSRWVDSFENFYEDMGDCPENYTLGRINNSLDYTPENTRWTTKSMQLFNRELGKIAGVNYRKDRDKWVATICKDYEIIRLGHFDTYEEAVEVRLKAEQDLFGEYSAKNFMADRDVCKESSINQ